MRTLLFAASIAVLSSSAHADVKLPAVLSDNMVLQQNADVRLWGWARPSEEVSVSPSWQKAPVRTKADAKGHWEVRVPTPGADKTSHTIVFAGDNELTIRDVLIGEVWVCSGQSNMEWPIHLTDNWQAETKDAANPAIRIFTVENTIAAEPREDCKGKWQHASPESVKNFSAVGYYFGRELNRELGIPIGLVSADWGGTPAEAWTSEQGLSTMPEWTDELAQVRKLRADANALRAEHETQTRAWMKRFEEIEPGSRAGSSWAAPELDDASWAEANQPGAWGGELADHDGTVWVRRAVDIPEAMAGKDLKLELGPIDDNDTTYFNGEVVGEKMAEGSHTVAREYFIPARLAKAGRSVIAVRMLDTGGPGGMMGEAGQLRLSGVGGSIALAGPWKIKVGAKKSALPSPPRMPGIAPWMVTSLYNGMIAPLTPMSVRGVIWYQGESNRERAHQYRSLFPAMIHDWRAQWNMPRNRDFPFFFVQIAPFAYGGDKGEAAELREAQMLTSALPNTGMAVTMDIGNPRDIHPTNKKEVGRRLSLWALAKTYGKKVECSGPTMKSFTVRGNQIEIAFDHAKDLNTGGNPMTPPSHFMIAGKDRKFVPAKAVIDGEKVIVSADGVAAPVAVRYAWGAADEPNLKNSEGLPASSFRTDDWPGVTVKPKAQSRLDVRDGVMRLSGPIGRWDEGVPLGNGLVGALVWGEGNTIRLSLDRGDLWDLRSPEAFKDPRWNYKDMQRMVAVRDEKTFHDLFDVPYDTVPYPTKLPGGRVEITLPEGTQVGEFRLDLRRAEARVELCGEPAGELTAFVGPDRPVVLVKLPPSATPRIRLVRPAGLDRLGYAEASEGREGDMVWLVQKAAGDLTYAIVAAVETTQGGHTLAVAITSTVDGPDALAYAREKVMLALKRGYEPTLALNEHWWKEHGSRSSVALPDPLVQAHYDLCKYLYGAASRPGLPPMPLQGLWTADEGGLPPWKGDYHNDLNTQMTYLAYLTAGLFECGQSWIDFNWKLLPRYREFARSFYGVEGAAIPGVMALDGSPLGGWGMYSLSPTNGLWVAQAFDLHWKYTGDERFMRERAYPFCSEVVMAIEAMMKPGESGKLKLPLSSSPEIHDNSYRAWLKPHSNYDQALVNWGVKACHEMAGDLKLGGQTAGWNETAHATFDRLDTDASGALSFAKGEPYTGSHRHFSHAMAIHPLGLLTIEGTPEERRIINATLDSIHGHGTSAWCGYSFGWFSCMLARCGRPEMALDYLERYHRGFILRNGFHCNGDQSGTGMSNFTYRPFTLEGNFLAMQAVHEMLLQSWGGVIRVFPAVSERWRDVSMTNLCAEGGFRVTASRRDGKTVKVDIRATVKGVVRVRDPFDGAGTWSRDGTRMGTDIEFSLERGEVVSGSAK